MGVNELDSVLNCWRRSVGLLCRLGELPLVRQELMQLVARYASGEAQVMDFMAQAGRRGGQVYGEIIGDSHEWHCRL